MRKSSKIISAAAIAVVAAAGGTAFTGAGVTDNAGVQFVGGSVTQDVQGAVLQKVAYQFDDTAGDASNTKVKLVTLTFFGHDVNTQDVTVANGGDPAIACGDPTTDRGGTPVGDLDTSTSTCTVDSPYWANLAVLHVNVTSTNPLP